MGNEISRNSHAMFVCNGASNHSDGERQVDDYYATEPKATELLLGVEKFNHTIWECACGGGHISEVLKKHGHNVFNIYNVNGCREYNLQFSSKNNNINIFNFRFCFLL